MAVQPAHLAPFKFTAATAAQFAAKSHAARRLRKLPPALPAQVAPDYAERRLKRVRAQLDRIDAMLMKEQDPQKLDRLASAQARLSVQEFGLSGRPMPGNRRPGREPSRRAAVAIDPQPAGPQEPPAA